jgi:hypothetical protein
MNVPLVELLSRQRQCSIAMYGRDNRGGSVCLNSELGLDEWISCRVQAATGCGSLSK